MCVLGWANGYAMKRKKQSVKRRQNLTTISICSLNEIMPLLGLHADQASTQQQKYVRHLQHVVEDCLVWEVSMMLLTQLSSHFKG